MSQNTKNFIAFLFVLFCLLALAYLLTPPEVVLYLKKLINYFLSH
jgi:hypothetical protein